MRKVILALMLGVAVVSAGQDPSMTRPAKGTKEPQYKVLNPWAEVDPVAPRGISPRLNSLAGRRIGLFANFKRAAWPIATEVGKRLKSMYPDCETSLYESRGANVVEAATVNREQFVDWVKGVDAVVLAVGD